MDRCKMDSIGKKDHTNMNPKDWIIRQKNVNVLYAHIRGMRKHFSMKSDQDFASITSRWRVGRHHKSSKKWLFHYSNDTIYGDESLECGSKILRHLEVNVISYGWKINKQMDHVQHRRGERNEYFSTWRISNPNNKSKKAVYCLKPFDTDVNLIFLLKNVIFVESKRQDILIEGN